MNSSIQSGAFSGYLHLLNDQGEYNGSSFRGIGFYSDYLDTLAQKLASTLNTLNSTTKDLSGNYIEDPNKALLAGTKAGGGDSILGSDITAKNIHVAAVWKDGILTRTKDVSPSGGNGASQSNINSMITQLRNATVALSTSSGATIYTGTLGSAFADAGGMLAQGTNSVQSTDDTNSNQKNTVDGQRQAISSVSLDDEAISIVQYTQSLNASSRFMTAVDECLQTIINNMGLAGR